MKNRRLEEIIELIIDFAGLRRNALKIESKIENDLGITGDDADELIELFIKQFNVKSEGFDSGKYFDEEGFDPIGISIFIRKLLKTPVPNRSDHDLTVGDLATWVERGYWVDPE